MDMIEEPPVISVVLFMLLGLMGLFSGLSSLPLLLIFVLGLQVGTNFETPVMTDPQDIENSQGQILQDPAHESVQ